MRFINVLPVTKEEVKAEVKEMKGVDPAFAAAGVDVEDEGNLAAIQCGRWLSEKLFNVGLTPLEVVTCSMEATLKTLEASEELENFDVYQFAADAFNTWLASQNEDKGMN